MTTLPSNGGTSACMTALAGARRFSSDVKKCMGGVAIMHSCYVRFRFNLLELMTLEICIDKIGCASHVLVNYCDDN